MARKRHIKYRWKLLQDGTFGVLAPNNRTICSGLSRDEAVSKVQDLNKDYGKPKMSKLSAKLDEIKDRSPNPDTIANLEYALAKAKAGEIRTVISIYGWDDDSVTRGWSWDRRNSPRRLLAESLLLQHDMANNIGLLEKDSVLNHALEDLEDA